MDILVIYRKISEVGYKMKQFNIPYHLKKHPSCWYCHDRWALNVSRGLVFSLWNHHRGRSYWWLTSSCCQNPSCHQGTPPKQQVWWGGRGKVKRDCFHMWPNLTKWLWSSQSSPFQPSRLKEIYHKSNLWKFHHNRCSCFWERTKMFFMFYKKFF